MLIDIIIPTLNRPFEKQRLEASIYIDIKYAKFIVANLIVKEETGPRPLTAIVNEAFQSSISKYSVGAIVLADHIEIQRGFFQGLQEAFSLYGTDKYFGFNVTNMPPNPGVLEYSFFYIGKHVFEKHFPTGEIFCPDYYHFFGDTELGEFANSLGVFHYLPKATIKTYHPNAGNAPRDLTNVLSRCKAKEDREIRKLRQKKELLWGSSFERVAEYGDLINPNAK